MNLDKTEFLPRINKLEKNKPIATQIVRNVVSKVVEKKAVAANEREERLDLIRSRLSENFYHSPEVYKKIAKGLIRDMNLIITDECWVA